MNTADLDSRNERKRVLMETWLACGVQVIVTFDPFFKGVVIRDSIKFQSFPARLHVWSFHDVGAAGFTCLLSYDKDEALQPVTIPWSAIYGLGVEDWQEYHLWAADQTIAHSRYALSVSPMRTVIN